MDVQLGLPLHPSDDHRVPAAMAHSSLAPATLLRAAKHACQDARDGRLDEASLRELADAGEALAVAACAQVFLFRGKHTDATMYAARYLRAPSPKATSYLYRDMCTLLRSWGDEALLAETARAVEPRTDYAHILEACLCTDRYERELFDRATAGPCPDARQRFAAALADADGRRALARGSEARFRYEIELAWTFSLDDELLERYRAHPERFRWSDRLEVAFAWLRRGEPMEAVDVLDSDPRRWCVLDAGQVVPVELATHPVLKPLWTPARAARWLASPRGP